MIANELGLGLRQATGLCVLGVTMEKTGQVEFAKACFREVLRLTRWQGYAAREREAEAHLRELGEKEL